MEQSASTNLDIVVQLPCTTRNCVGTTFTLTKVDKTTLCCHLQREMALSGKRDHGANAVSDYEFYPCDVQHEAMRLKRRGGC